MNGRFAPSPSGPLHVGNLRTALLAWLIARQDGGRFRVRLEDLTTGAAPTMADAQLRDLVTLGLDHDGPVVRQSERRDAYIEALLRLEALGLTYPCFCTRREIAEAAAAPHGPSAEGAYPGTCARLSTSQRARRAAQGRPPALRLRAGEALINLTDELAGPVEAVVDDLVLQRADGLPAYNLAVVVDDADQDVGRVVRGDDLLETTPRQVHLARLLGLPVPAFLHVPLVLGPDGERLAKRHGAVGLDELRAAGVSPVALLARFGVSIGALAEAAVPEVLGSSVGELLAVLLERFDRTALSRGPWVFDPPTSA